MATAENSRTSDKIFWLKFMVSSGLAVALLLSRNLWMSSRAYPLTPVLPGFPSPPKPFDLILLAGCIVLLALIAGIRRPIKLITMFAGLAGTLAMLDQSRWQPWFYQYMLMLLAVAWVWRTAPDAEQESRCLNAWRLIVFSVYLWSGIQKLNGGFIHNIFPWLMEPVTQLLPTAWAAVVAGAGAVVPLTESGIALLLLTRKCRNLAVIGAVGMHLFILAELGPAGHNANSVIWFWNVTMVCIVVLLFWRSPQFSAMDLVRPPGGAFPKVLFALCTVAPLLSVFHLWDNYLSWALYAGNKDTAELYIASSVQTRLPESVREYVNDESKPTESIDIAQWSAEELNVPPYPEARIYKNIARYVCRYAQEPQEVTLIVQNKRALFNGGKRSRYDCSSLSH